MLKWVQIRNFRSCGNTVVPLFDSVTALVGKNGVGKSNVLLAIEWMARRASSPTDLDMPTYAPNQDPFEITARLELGSQQYEYFVRYQGPFVRESIRKDFVERLSILTPNGEHSIIFDRTAGIVITPLRDVPLLVGTSAASMASISSLLPADDVLNLAIEPVKTFFAGIQYYLIDDSREGMVSDLVVDTEYQKWRQRYVAEGALTKSVAYRLLYMFHENREMLNEFRSLVGPEGLGIVNFVGVETIDAQPATGGQKSGLNKYHFFQFIPLEGMGGSGSPRTFSSLSSGTRRAIRMLVSLLFDRRSLMLIEEPEVSIHPGLLRKIVGIFRTYSPISQVIFTTHSAEVLNVLNPAEIVLLSAPAGNTLARVLGPDEIALAHKFLCDEGSLADYFETTDEFES
ncbi:MAG TPA: ATP-binding protein [Tepidisphaeraceae bacterium]|jgi:predicted ATPase|nr:ATP-binding protein [Tepidisphaeraceae bacterium]